MREAVPPGRRCELANKLVDFVEQTRRFAPRSLFFVQKKRFSQKKL